MVSVQANERCTWVDPPDSHCEEVASHPQTGKDGVAWANLCDAHHKVIEDAFGVDARATLRYWIRAQGGTKAAAARMTGGKR